MVFRLCNTLTSCQLAGKVGRLRLLSRLKTATCWPLHGDCPAVSSVPTSTELRFLSCATVDPRSTWLWKCRLSAVAATRLFSKLIARWTSYEPSWRLVSQGLSKQEEPSLKLRCFPASTIFVYRLPAVSAVMEVTSVRRLRDSDQCAVACGDLGPAVALLRPASSVCSAQ